MPTIRREQEHTHWGEFLQARMATIDEFDREGKSPDEILSLLNMDRGQVNLLLVTAREKRIASQRTRCEHCNYLIDGGCVHYWHERAKQGEATAKERPHGK